MEKITKYKSYDGREFDNPEDCAKHEDISKIQAIIQEKYSYDELQKLIEKLEFHSISAIAEVIMDCKPEIIQFFNKKKKKGLFSGALTVSE